MKTLAVTNEFQQLLTVTCKTPTLMNNNQAVKLRGGHLACAIDLD